MDKVMEYLNLALSWLNNPTVKYGLGMVGGFLWKKAPSTVNRAYPMVAMAASALLTLSGVLTKFLEGFGPSAANASFSAQFASAAGAISVPDAIVAIIMGTVLPVIAAVGTHSWWKNAIQWIADGYRIRKAP